MNHTSTAADVERVLDWFASAQVPTRRRRAPARSPVRHADVRAGWLGEPQFSRDEVAAAPIFMGLDDAQLDTVAGWAREQRIAAGEEVIRVWDAARDFYVILDGAARSTATERSSLRSGRETSSARWRHSTGGPAMGGHGPQPSGRPASCASCRCRHRT